MTDVPWMGRDHVLIVQAARNLEDAPEYAKQLVATADDPMTAALQLVALLMTERVGLLTEGPIDNE